MTSPRLLAHLGALGLIVGACAPANSDTGSPTGGASATGGKTAASGGAIGSGTGGDPGTGGDTGTGGLVGTGGETGSGGAAVGTGGRGTGGGAGAGMASGGAGGQVSGGGSTGTGPSCPMGVGFCDDFESYAEGTSPGAAAAGRWMAVRMGTGTTLAVDSMQAYSGSKALHITGKNLTGGVSATGSTVVISSKPGDPAFAGSPTTGYVRFMMFLKTYTQTQGSMNHNRMVRIGNDTIDSLSNPMGYAIDLHYHQPAHFKLEQFNDVYYTDSDPMPLLGKWVCWEYQVGPDKTAHVWMNGTEVKGTLPSKWATQTVKFSKLTIGFESYTALPEVELWYDDVAFDATKRVGCPAAK
ncbi:MAG: hypothetical protein ABJA82_00730 [Myxococcales bacterium]